MTRTDAKQISAVAIASRKGAFLGALIPLLLVIATVAVYAPILSNAFVELDDQAAIYQNPNLTHLTWYSFYVFWTRPYLNLYAPLTYTLFAVIALFARIGSADASSALVPFHAWPFHAVSLLLHVLTVLVVYRLLRCIVRRPWPAAVGALLFSLHPVQVETVAWATEINGLLCGLLSLTAILLYLRSKGISDGPLLRRASIDENDGAGACRPGRAEGTKRTCGPTELTPPGSDDQSSSDGALASGASGQSMTPRQRRGWYILATEVFLFAMLAKPLGVIVPLLAGVLYWAVAVGDGRVSIGRRRFPWGLVFWLILAIPMAMIAKLSQPVPEDWVYVPLWLRPLVAGDALAFYLYKLLFPITLVPDYNHSPSHIRGNFAVFYTWILPVVVAVILLRFCWRRRAAVPLAAGAIWFVVALLPVLGMVPFAFQRMSTVADRYLYLPMVGVGLCAAWWLDRITLPDTSDVSRNHQKMKLLIGFSILVLVALGVRTFLQTHFWHDSETLFKHSMEVIGRRPGAREGQPW